ncbi:MAG: threonine synthase [Sphingobacteriales bacterium]|nr:threonine synthase [Sphingobacteriales bacterium]
MKYYSLNHQSPTTDFKEATIRGQAPDKGLYFPEVIPQVDNELIENIEQYSNEEIAFRVIRPYVGDVIPDEELKRIVKETINFSIPLVKVTDDIYSLELFHGPTLAFKDVGARFMSRCLGYFVKDQQKKVIVLVATSGDTGGAVANGFYNVEGVEVVILYPSGKVSSVQEKQLTTLGNNIHALEVKGNFDDCQQMVKRAFADEELTSRLFLTSANSINVARWLPQQFYYFLAWKQWPYKNEPPVICVPSGNFGNICAGMLANQSGLPVKKFIAACNANDIIPNYLHSGKLNLKPAVATISNAMDVANPSNFIRIMELFHQHLDETKAMLESCSIDDATTRRTIKTVYDKYHYLLDPHSAVAFKAMEDYQQQHPSQKGIIVSTAHPVKFPEVVEQEIGRKIDIPDSVKGIMDKQSVKTTIEVDYESLTNFIKNI